MLRFGHLAGLLSATCTLSLWAASGIGADLEIGVLDRDGRPVSDVVVVASPRRGVAAPTPVEGSHHAVMDQVDRQFVPRILVIRAGTPVDFPNSDNVAHQVYSFSPAKRFQLSLYRGHVYPPLLFDQAGLVVLGCNIHDNMLGFIYVTPSPYFGKTGASGTLHLDGLPAGDYEISAWNPRFNESNDEVTKEVQVSVYAQPPVMLRLTKALSPELRPKPTKASRNGY
jgi:plastocyanin